MADGKRPDFDVLVAVPYEGKERDDMAFHNVGAGWSSENGLIWLNVVTMPGVKLLVKKREEKRNGKDKVR